MHVLGTLTSTCRSLADFFSELTRKKLLLGALGLGVALGATTASAAPFLDDFSVNTAANYVSEDSFGSGGSFEISGGTLNITTGSGNTFTVTTAAPVSFEVGESLAVDVPPQVGSNGLFLTLGTAVGQPGAAGGDGYRWRRDAGPTGGLEIFQAAAGSIITDTDPDKTSPATLWIDRTASDSFEFRIQLVGEITRTSLGTDTYSALGGITDLHIGMQAFDTSPTLYAFDNLRIVDTATIGDLNMTLIVDRDSGGLTLESDPNSAVTILGYAIQSESGAFDRSGWTPISGNYDASIGGDGSVDNDDEWTVLSAANEHAHLSEAELDLDGGNGATLAAGQSINLSQPGGAWIKNPSETDDVSLQVLFADGITASFPVDFTGNGGNPFTPVDLDFNNVINEQDWLVFVAGHLQDLSSLSLAQAYGMGDLDGDSDNDVDDFKIFKGAFDAANGAGAFAAMLGGVPEPSSIVLLGLGTCLLGIRRAADESQLADTDDRATNQVDTSQSIETPHLLEN